VTTFVDQMQQIAAAIRTPEVFATADPEEAASNRPCVLVTPPRLNYAAGTLDGAPLLEYRVACLSSRAVGDAAALEEFPPLIDAVVAAIPTLEDATPSAYQLATDKPQVPAYLITFTR
jgi:hypothetical protein